MTGDVIWDFFCGAGGFSLGFHGKENTLIGFDMNELALKTYVNNLLKVYKNVQVFNIDIMDIVIESNKLNKFGYMEMLIKGEEFQVLRPDIIIGSPPCQDFSLANRFKKQDTSLVEKFLEIKDAIKPKWWVMEEVPAVGKIGEKKGWFKARYLKACEFNLPHVRKRLFAGNYPDPVKKEYNRKLLKTPQAQIRGYGHGKEDRGRERVVQGTVS